MVRPEQYVLADPELILPEGQEFLLEEWMFRTKDGLPIPHFSPQDVASIFFARSIHWFRNFQDPRPPDYPEGRLFLDGNRIEIRRTPRGNRYYSLADVERICYALADQRIINARQLSTAMKTVKSIAQTYEAIV